MTETTRYPAYDVWEQHAEWDEHTQHVVGKRRMAKLANRFFTHAEGLQMQTVAALLIDENRQEVLSFVMEHLDEKLVSPIGESQRKVGIPVRSELYRKGLAGIDEASHAAYRASFLALDRERQLDILSHVAEGKAAQTEAWKALPQKEFFKALLNDVVSACYSHPAIWSEIGYGGPAYPRGYVRVEKGLVDPWEAKRNGE
ncbi:gluconate 2-dehydrogenase subunit 3 family protein [Brevibacillus fluminis]|uniref:Gluconate 2-dehydrogenase subunit 3 family protein n=1 Tax=Brevibacillus fluminis TaxID=511487 RepID=A0A3M8DTS2_9BACL|nr:gluconate 2-dehydrogenase subunit 3 family protein [Brevibacillus fluminis]RNB91482.1 gluconate 2-dehydrogenase subunit 3 family protein [Brevibacillus fluminis]